jgi:SAM-dependent methyltransferase
VPKVDEHWSRFWATKSDPLHSSSEDHYYDCLGGELRLVLPDQFSSVLEVGCGNGCLYRRLGFDRVGYLGIDYSPAMIKAFEAAHPQAQVRLSDFRAVDGPKDLDLIFSHGVMQYIPPNEFDVEMEKAASLLRPGGHVVHAGVLRKSCRKAFMGGELAVVPDPWLKNRLRVLVEELGLRRSMGYWYSIPDVRKTALRHGFSARFFGSVLNPYRFHVVMRKSGRSE